MKRSGSSLLELMLAIGISGVVVTLVTTLLAAMWRAEQRLRADANERQSLARLELALRQDIHAAAAASVTDDGTLRLNLSENKLIVYSIDRQRVVRTTLSGVKEDHRDSYLLPSDCDIAWTIQDRLVLTTIEPQRAANGSRKAAVAAVLAAALGVGRLPAVPKEGAP